MDNIELFGNTLPRTMTTTSILRGVINLQSSIAVESWEHRKQQKRANSYGRIVPYKISKSITIKLLREVIRTEDSLVKHV